MKKEISIFDAANFILRQVDREEGSTITHLKLQKILYYAQGFYLAMKDKELFPEEFEAWSHGPVNPAIYQKYKKYGYEMIPKPNVDLSFISDEVCEFLSNIWASLGIYDGKYLEELTHSEAPWIEARKGYPEVGICHEIISKESMRIFFKSKLVNDN